VQFYFFKNNKGFQIGQKNGGKNLKC